MNGLIAILLCTIGVAFLFYYDRDRSIRNSKALWLPVLWIGLASSRGVSEWFSSGPAPTVQDSLQGNPIDAAVFAFLLLIGLVVLFGRKRKAGAYLPVIVPILIYSAYCLASVAWAPYSLPAFKRWTKDVGDVVMVLIVMTDPQPINAIRRLYTRLGFILFPFSIVLIRYTLLGRAWDNEGHITITGVTTNKNMLGLIVFVLSLGVVWNVRWLFMNRNDKKLKRRLIAEGVLLLFGLILLRLAGSSTSLACFLLGSTLILLTHTRFVRKRPVRIHFICLSMVVMGFVAFFLGGAGDVAGALGRDTTLTGRTFMWAAMFPAVTNPLIGVGFDSFWTSPNADVFHHNLNLMHWYHSELINEAHNGYIEVYLNLGWIGVSLIALLLITGYWQAYKAFRRDPELGSLFLALVMCGAVYGITEAGFRTLSPNWVFLLLAMVGSSGVNAGLLSNAQKRTRTQPVPEAAGTAVSAQTTRPAAFTV